MRIVSMLPSATEIVCLLGARDQLVGVSHECDFPAGVGDLPSVTRSRLDIDASSRTIHDRVQSVLQTALSVYEVDVPTLDRLRPDVIVTQDLCEVCAVSHDDVKAALATLQGRDVEVVSLHPKVLEDIFDDVRRTGRAIGHDGEEAARTLAQRFASVASPRDTRPSILAVEWLDPVMIGGLWMPEVIEAGGGVSLGPARGVEAKTLDRAELEAMDPDIVVLKPCGFDLERTIQEKACLRKVLPWNQWRAVESGQVYAVDGNAYFNRPGPRMVESAEIIAAIAHGEHLDRHRGSIRKIDRDLEVTELS